MTTPRTALLPLLLGAAAAMALFALAGAKRCRAWWAEAVAALYLDAQGTVSTVLRRKPNGGRLVVEDLADVAAENRRAAASATAAATSEGTTGALRGLSRPNVHADCTAPNDFAPSLALAHLCDAIRGALGGAVEVATLHAASTDEDSPRFHMPLLALPRRPSKADVDSLRNALHHVGGYFSVEFTGVAFAPEGFYLLGTPGRNLPMLRAALRSALKSDSLSERDPARHDALADANVVCMPLALFKNKLDPAAAAAARRIARRFSECRLGQLDVRSLTLCDASLRLSDAEARTRLTLPLRRDAATQVTTWNGREPHDGAAPGESTSKAFDAHLGRNLGIAASVAFTHDHELVCIGDATLDRLTGGRDTRRIESVTRDEVFGACSPAGGLGFAASLRLRGGRVATLADLLALADAHAVQGAEGPVFLHLQPAARSSNALDALVAALKNAPHAAKRIVVAGLNADWASSLKARMPNLKLAATVGNVPDGDAAPVSCMDVLWSIDDALAWRDGRAGFEWVLMHEFGVSSAYATASVADVLRCKLAGLHVAIATAEVHSETALSEPGALFARIRSLLALDPHAIVSLYPSQVVGLLNPPPRM